MTRERCRVVVSVLAREVAELERLAVDAAGGDLVELRLDHLLDCSVEALARCIAGAPRPVIAASHATGAPESTPEARIALLARAAEAGAAYVDLDEALLAHGSGLPSGVKRILSRHVDASGSSTADLDALARPLDAAARAGDVVKLVVAGSTAEDALRAMRWLAARRAPTAAFCTGEAALASRALAPAFGSALVYAASDDPRAAPTASGQRRVGRLRATWRDGVPPEAFARGTRLAGILGRPLAHSASPEVYARAQRALGLDAVFVPLEAESLEAALAEAADERWRGFSVTAPFKVDALQAAASRDEDAAAIGAANTLVRRADGRWHAANTDVVGITAALDEAGAPRDGSRALVVGAGGAARAALHALLARGAAVTVAARRLAAASECVRGMDAEAMALDRLPARARSEEGGPAFDVVVHATPLGTLGSGEAPVPDELLGPGVHVLDAVYRPAVTGLVRRARARGATAIEGGRWFAHQASAQLARIHGGEAGGDAALLGSSHFEARVRIAVEAACAAALGDAPREALPRGVACVVLVGLRCAGKSTAGLALAARLGASFVDLDVALESLAAERDPAAPRASAGELLARRGEPAFRALERDALAGVLASLAERREPIVLATGGGVVEDERNRRDLAALGARARVVWLDAPIEVLGARLERSATPRPSLTGAAPAEELAELFARRAPLYGSLASARVDARGDVACVVDSIVRALVHRSVPT